MTTEEFIRQEITHVVKEEVKNTFDNQNHPRLIQKLEAYLEENEPEELHALFEKDTEFKQLKNALFYLEQLALISDIEISIRNMDIIDKKLKANPADRLLALIWVFYVVELFEEEEFLDIEYADVLKTIFDSYDFLVNLEDFFYETRLLYVKPLYEEWIPDIYIPIINNAAIKYPNKYFLKYMNGFILYQKEAYREALEVLQNLTNLIEQEEKQNPEQGIGSMDFSYEDYMQAHHFIGLIYYDLGEFEKAKTQLDFVLENLPVIEMNDDIEEEIISEFADGFFTRMRLNIKKDDREAVIKDYERINGRIIAQEEYEKEYSDVFEYLIGKGDHH